MSTLLENKFFHIENVLYSKFFVVQKESLADLVRRVRNEKDYSLMDVRMRSGKQLATSYISRIENGEVVNVGLEKLTALAKGLEISEEEVFAAARGKQMDNAKLTHEKLATIDFAYPGIPKQKRANVDYLIELLDNEIKKIKAEEKGNK